jgi:hypothetical protein
MDATTLIGLAQRSKIILNLRREDAEKYSETHRLVMHSAWHRALVMSEPGGAAPPFEAGRDLIEAPLEEIPERIRYYLSSREGQEEAQAVVTHGFETFTEKCRLSALLHPLIVRLYGRSWRVPFFQFTSPSPPNPR